jgi:hypothetical protein
VIQTFTGAFATNVHAINHLTPGVTQRRKLYLYPFFCAAVFALLYAFAGILSIRDELPAAIPLIACPHWDDGCSLLDETPGG